jgi:hypothetical protein
MLGTDEVAVRSADEMIDQLLKTQPGLIAYVGPNGARGKDIAEIVAGLRKGLTEMYAATPKVVSI